MTSVFAKFIPKAYPFQFTGELTVHNIAGGTPSNPKIAEGWLKTKWSDKDEEVVKAVAEVMAERGVSEEVATKAVSDNRHLNGFKRDETTGELYLDGRCLKAAIKEAANVRWPKKKWGVSNKGTTSYWAEHFFVMDERLALGTKEPSRIDQQFIHKWTGSAIQYNEVIEETTVTFSLQTDADLTTEEWALLWLTGEQQGLGASRSQGYGRYEVTGWSKTK